LSLDRKSRKVFISRKKRKEQNKILSTTGGGGKVRTKLCKTSSEPIKSGSDKSYLGKTHKLLLKEKNVKLSWFQ